LMLFHRWGGKTLYYSLVNKIGSKSKDEELPALKIDAIEDEESCESCVL
jgi:hypothetical protein